MTRLRRLGIANGTPPFRMARPQLSINETQFLLSTKQTDNTK